MTIREFPETITLTVPLTAADHEEIHAEMIERNTQRARQEDKIEQYKAAISAAKKEVDTLNSHIYEGIEKLETGTKTVPLECRKIIDYEAGLVRYVSVDTKDIVKERLLNDDEKQMVFDFPNNEVPLVEETASPDAHPDDAPGDMPEQTAAPRRGRPSKKESVAYA
jgi:hypothetical protein